MLAIYPMLNFWDCKGLYVNIPRSASQEGVDRFLRAGSRDVLSAMAQNRRKANWNVQCGREKRDCEKCKPKQPSMTRRGRGKKRKKERKKARTQQESAERINARRRDFRRSETDASVAQRGQTPVDALVDADRSSKTSDEERRKDTPRPIVRGGRWNVGHETEREKKKRKGCQGTHTQIYATHRSVEMPAMIQTLTEHREERQSSLHTFFLFYPTRQEQRSRLAQGASY